MEQATFRVVHRIQIVVALGHDSSVPVNAGLQDLVGVAQAFAELGVRAYTAGLMLYQRELRKLKVALSPTAHWDGHGRVLMATQKVMSDQALD